MKRVLFIAAGVVFFLGLVGFVVASLGLVPLKASAGHWAITEAILQFGKRRSIATHTLGAEAPALGDPKLVLKGAGHYETGCRPCHGSPDLKQPRVARAMLPPPPYLAESRREWKPEELVYIVQHGIKFTGMPAFPAPQRVDEVEAVVAFVLVLPTLDARAYEELVFGEAPSSDPHTVPLEMGSDAVTTQITSVCGRCHGVDGNGRGAGAFPKLAGQSRDYMVRALDAYARDARLSGFMQPIAADLTAAEMVAVSDHYARLAPDEPLRGSVDAIARGGLLARRGAPEKKVPSCVHCHDPEGGPQDPAYPVLNGQYADYLELQLRLFAEGHRGGSEYAAIMQAHVAPRLTREERRDLALYYASISRRRR